MFLSSKFPAPLFSLKDWFRGQHRKDQKEAAAAGAALAPHKPRRAAAGAGGSQHADITLTLELHPNMVPQPDVPKPDADGGQQTEIRSAPSSNAMLGMMGQTDEDLDERAALLDEQSGSEDDMLPARAPPKQRAAAAANRFAPPPPPPAAAANQAGESDKQLAAACRRLAQTTAAKNENNLFVKNRNPRSLCMKAGEAFTHIADAVGRDPAEMLKVIHCLHSRVGL